MAIELAYPQQPKGRKERETAQWLDLLGRYQQAKESALESNSINTKDTQLEQWVFRQRSLHKLGRLRDWKLKALREAHFDLIARQTSPFRA